MSKVNNKQQTIPVALIDEDELKVNLARKKYLAIKRSFDVIASSFFIFVLIIPVLFIAAIISIESNGNPIFKQKRVGRDGKPFTMFKLRTMRMNVDASSATFAKINDERITKFGKFLRRTRIDETPQLINVLIGDMSIIGPRPEQLRLMPYIRERIPQFVLREVLRPGITGWAQVHQGYADDMESSKAKLEFDIFYIKNVSLILDARILLLTLHTVIRGHGAR